MKSSDETEDLPSDDVLRGMDEAMENFPRVSEAIDLREPPNRFCEVRTGNGECGKPATHAYPASRGGYMALCSQHSKEHPEAWPIKEI